MTAPEFSESFDTLVNSYASKIPFGQDTTRVNLSFDEYEKSQFLTTAQDEIVLSLYTGRNVMGLSFEETEELRRYLSNLIVEAELQPMVGSSGKAIGIDGRARFFTLPDGGLSGKTTEEDAKEEVKPAVWFITYESVIISDGDCSSHTSLDVVPVTQDEYHRIRKNPFRGPNKRRALRLDLSDGIVEIICNYTITTYYIRYLREPKPILLEELPDGLSIKGEIVPQKPCCELHPALHQRILERAIELAVRSRVGNSPSRAASQQERN